MSRRLVRATTEQRLPLFTPPIASLSTCLNLPLRPRPPNADATHFGAKLVRSGRFVGAHCCKLFRVPRCHADTGIILRHWLLLTAPTHRGKYSRTSSMADPKNFPQRPRLRSARGTLTRRCRMSVAYGVVGRGNAPQNAERSEGRLRSNAVGARKRPLLGRPRCVEAT